MTYPVLLPRRRRGPFYEDDEETLVPAPVVAPPAPRPLLAAPVPEPIATEPVKLAPPPLVNAGPAPATITDRRGRPRLMPGLENEVEAQRQLRGEVQAYEPQKRMGWKDFGLSALQGFLRGGLPGAAAASLQRVIRPTYEDEVWQQGQLQRTGADIDQLMQEQRVGLQDELLRSQVEENRAQAQRAKLPPRPILSRDTLPDGTVIQTELNRETGQYEPVVRGDQPVVLIRPKPERRVPFKLSTGETVLISPETAASADAQRVGRVEAGERRGEDRQLQQDAARDEFESLVIEENAAKEEKDRAYSALSQLKQDYSALLANSQTPVEVLQRTEDDIREATRAAQTADSHYKSFGSRKTAAQAKVKRYSTPLQRPGQVSGVTLEGALDAFRRDAKREPTAEEIANIKSYYNLP